jgi:hypothetical protein
MTPPSVGWTDWANADGEVGAAPCINGAADVGRLPARSRGDGAGQRPLSNDRPSTLTVVGKVPSPEEGVGCAAPKDELCPGRLNIQLVKSEFILRVMHKLLK